MLITYNILPIMQALCLMFLPSYYAQNYAGIIGSSLVYYVCEHAVMFIEYGVADGQFL